MLFEYYIKQLIKDTLKRNGVKHVKPELIDKIFNAIMTDEVTIDDLAYMLSRELNIGIRRCRVLSEILIEKLANQLIAFVPLN